MSIVMKENPSFHYGKEKIGGNIKKKGNVTAAVRSSGHVCHTDVLQDLFDRHEFRYDMKWQLL